MSKCAIKGTSKLLYSLFSSLLPHSPLSFLPYFRIVYYDSYGDNDSALYLKTVLQWLREMAIAVRFVSLGELSEHQEWTLTCGDSNQQKNSTDCGIFTMMNIHCLAFSMPLVCNAENAKLCREAIAASLLRGKLK